MMLLLAATYWAAIGIYSWMVYQPPSGIMVFIGTIFVLLSLNELLRD